MLQQPFHQLAPRIFRIRAGHIRRIARQQHLRLDMDQERRHIDELARRIHVRLLQLVAIVQKLRRDHPNRNVVDIDTLLADQVQQQVQRPVIHLSHRHRKRRLRCLLGLRVLRLLQRRQGRGHRPRLQLEPLRYRRNLLVRGNGRNLTALYLFTHRLESPTAVNTCRIVTIARPLARNAPSSRIASTSSGFAS